MTVAQFIPDASPVTCKFGWLVVEERPLLRLGGEPVDKSDDNRLDALLALVIELDILVYFIIAIQPTANRSSPRRFYGKNPDGALAPSEI
jgi:hypothetical protein